MKLLDILIEVAKREVIAPEAWGGAAAIYLPPPINLCEPREVPQVP